jgi:hypothetical protein
MSDRKASERDRKALDAARSRESVQKAISLHEAYVAKLPTLYEGDLLGRMVKAGANYLDDLRRALKE